LTYTISLDTVLAITRRIMAYKDKEKQRRMQKLYREKNREKRNAQKREYYRANKEIHRKRSAKWREDNPDKWLEMMRESNRRQRERLRKEMIDAYGGKCACCGETEALFLELDHVNNDGAEDRKENGYGVKLMCRLKKKGWPKDRYQILCSNCNQGKNRNGGICPHKTQ
jgi:hypothetical protein